MLMEMDDLNDQLSARDRLMRRQWEQLAPVERVREMFRLQELTWQILRSSPRGYANFIRRNFKARAVDPLIDSNGGS